jgi:hypothetical protein
MMSVSVVKTATKNFLFQKAGDAQMMKRKKVYKTNMMRYRILP